MTIYKDAEAIAIWEGLPTFPLASEGPLAGTLVKEVDGTTYLLSLFSRTLRVS